ncbi:MAG: hypothetical protein FJX72_10095 [Armatimonadetes bacterium]|nr:hypothetical protein [Armatimonadota bacterium]
MLATCASGCAEEVLKVIVGLILWSALTPIVYLVAVPIMLVSAIRHPAGFRTGLADGWRGVWRWWRHMASIWYV